MYGGVLTAIKYKIAHKTFDTIIDKIFEWYCYKFFLSITVYMYIFFKSDK